MRSIADRTIAQSNSLTEFRHAFQERLKALARVNGLLSRLNTRQRITFSELVRSELSGMGILDARDGRVRLTGPENIKLRSSTVQTLALGLHELATNALKYGALSRPDRRLSVSWTVQRTADEEQRLKVEWRESAVAIKREPDAKPTRVGYGRELIEQALPYQLKAETTYLITPDGVHCTIALPLSTAQEGVLDV